MTIRAASLALLFPFATTALAEDTTDLPLSDCDVERIWTLDSPALGETVELRAELSVETVENGPGYEFPFSISQSARLSLVLADGKVLDLGEGGKYFDDVDWNAPPSCEDLANEVTVPTRVELAGEAIHYRLGSFEPRSETLTNLWALAMGGQDCMDSANLLPGETPSAECHDMQNYYESLFLEPDTERQMNYDTFQRLVYAEAPLIMIRRSAYYLEAYAWDAEARELRYVMAQGC